jgi:hypothetical protein
MSEFSSKQLWADDLRRAVYKPTLELIEKLDDHRHMLSMEEYAKLEYLKAEVRIWEERDRRKRA